jgi:CheY-like chemotaxis protein
MSPNLNNLTIIVVEDDNDVRRHVGAFLDHSGAKVVVARNGLEGLEAIKINHPHMVLSDIKMPAMDGFGLLREIRALGPNAGGSVPVIAMSAFVGQGERAYLLDWFHLTMRLTVLSQTAKGLPERLGEEEDKYELRTGVVKDLERIKWYLWHGNVFQALNELQSLEIALDAAAFESKNEHSQKLLKGVEELHTHVKRNQEFVPNCGERS